MVRLEDQFGNPVAGESISVTITQGEGTIVSADPTTNASGQVSIEVQAGTGEDDLIFDVTVPGFPGVAPVRFLSIMR